MDAGAYNPATGEVSEDLKKMRVMIQNFCRIKDGSLLPEIDLRRFAMDSGQIITNIIVQELCSLHTKILKLSLINCNQVSDVGLWAISKHCVWLKVLNCSGCDKITTVGLRSLSLRCSDMVELDLSNCTLVDDLALTVIAGGSWRLSKLSLARCIKVSDNGIVKIAQGLSNCLVHLNLNGCPNIGEFGDRGIKELGAHCHILKALLIDNAKRIEDAGLISLAKGCTEMETLMISGCETITKKSLKAMAEYFHKLKYLKIIQNRRLNDLDYQILLNSNMVRALHTLELENFESLTDDGVAVICKAFGPTLTRLHLLYCSKLTDYTAMIIGNMCIAIRELDLRYCGQFSDHMIHTLARKLHQLTSLKLDGNPRITTRALLQHIPRDFEFVNMASQWLGYEPKAHVDNLIAKKQELILHHRQAIKIQCLIRKRFAHQIYFVRYRERLIERCIPIFQAHVRGYFQRKRYALLVMQRHRIQSTIKIQCKFRQHRAYRQRMQIVKAKRFQIVLARLATLLQRMFRGMKARREIVKRRIELANERLAASRLRAKKEIQITLIQRIYRGYVAKQIVQQMYDERMKQEQWQAKVESAHRLLQRIAFGFLGRLRMRRRRAEVALAQLRWFQAREIQRIFRGFVARQIFEEMKLRDLYERQCRAATEIQRIYRGYRGQLLAAMARALKLLRARQQFCAVEIQRCLRGCMGRWHFQLHKEMVTRERRRRAAAMIVQRLYRGHRGREAYEIEYQLQILESRAKPLFQHLKQLEIQAQSLRKVVHQLEYVEQTLRESLFEIEKELEHCQKTTNKYTDSKRLNGSSQRFLTKFLQVRLQDLLDHEDEKHRVKHLELKKRLADLRDVEREILLTERELVPMTTGLIARVKKERSERLRLIVITRRKAAIKIQSIWRRALVRTALYDPYKEGWVKRFDKNQSDQPYYFNTISKQIRSTRPVAYLYFGERTVSALDALRHYSQDFSNGFNKQSSFQSTSMGNKTVSFVSRNK
jgi:hypothetical protein